MNLELQKFFLIWFDDDHKMLQELRYGFFHMLLYHESTIMLILY